MMGVVVLVKTLAQGSFVRRHFAVKIKDCVDSIGDTFAILNQYSRNPPPSYMHMELAALCANAGVVPQIKHCKRKSNTWADDLSKDCLGSWNHANQWYPDVSPASFEVFFRMLGRSSRQEELLR